MTNAKTATSARVAKTMAKLDEKLPKQVAQKPHMLTDADKVKGRAKAERMAAKPKASNQTAVLSAADKQQVANEARDRKPLETNKRKLAQQMDRELAAEAAKEGTVRAADQITVNKPAPNAAEYRMVGTTDGSPLMIPNHRFVGALAEAAKMGCSFRLFKAAWEADQKAHPGKLAGGLDGRNAPHSSKAVGDAQAKGTNKADKVQARKASATVAKAERKAARAEKAAPKADDNRKITILDKKFTYGKEGSARNASWLACKGSRTVADYAKAGGALKYLGRWASAGAIKLG